MSVAVVVPTHNRRELLEKLLGSLRGSGAAEVVVVSDGSDDGTDERVLELASGWDALRLLRTDRLGPGGARNAGWRSSRADVIAFIDDDCVAAPGWLDTIVEPFDDPRVGLVQGRTVPDGPMGPHDRSIAVGSEYGLYESCNIAYRRAALEGVGGFDERYGRRGRLHFGEDTHLAWRVRRAGWATRFAADAVVRHHVFARGYLESLRQEWGKSMFPGLMKDIPELRDLLPGGRWFLRRHSPVAQLALLGVVLLGAGRFRVAAVCLAPYTAWVVRRRGPGEAARQFGRDLTGSAGLVVGSVRSGSILL